MLASCSSSPNNNGGTIKPKDGGTMGTDDGGGVNPPPPGPPPPPGTPPPPVPPGTPPPPPGPPPPPPPGFDTNAMSASLAQAQCAFYARCQPAVMLSTMTDMAGCIAEVQPALKDNLDFLTPLVTAGRMTYNATKLNECVAELGSLDCQLGQLDTSPCNDYLVGTQALNAACSLSAECAPDSFCSRPQGFGSCGTCSAAATRGSSCANAPCARGAVCVNAGTQAMPQPVCVPNDAQENGMCFTLQTGLCRGQLQCVGPDMGPLTCRRPAARNAACDPMLTANPDCDIYANDTCDMGTCKEITWNAQGGMCGGTTFCGGDSYCPMGQTMCAGLPLAGASCAETGVCGADAYCDGQNNCAAVKPMGATCVSGNECQGDLSCLGTGMNAMCGTFNWTQCN